MGAHLIDGEFQSDKYPTCPRGKVPLSVKDPTAQDLLWEYAQRRRAVDAEFSADLEAALAVAGFDPTRTYLLPMDKRCADALADEVAVLVRRKVIDMRSPAADALLDYREPPTTPRADRLAEIEAELAQIHERREPSTIDVETDGAAPAVVRLALLQCLRAWEPSARVLGNVRAWDAERAILDAQDRVAALEVALQPFAAFVEGWNRGRPDNEEIVRVAVPGSGGFKTRATITLGDLRRASVALSGLTNTTERSEKLTDACEIERLGGPWLAAARGYVQRKARNGNSVTWGSGEAVTLSMRQLEEMCAHAVAADRLEDGASWARRDPHPHAVVPRTGGME